MAAVSDSDSEDEITFHPNPPVMVQPYMFEPRVNDRGEHREVPAVGQEDRTDNTNWCSCSQCKAMSTAVECYCCQELEPVKQKLEELDSPVSCNSQHPGFEPDTKLTWKGNWPQFTNCFQHTVLVWVSCGFLWITSPLYVFYLTCRQDNIFPFTALFIVKLFTCCSLFVLRIVQLFHALDNSSGFDAEVSDYTIHLITYILLFMLITTEKRKGVITSPIVFFFWLISLLVHIIPFYSKIKMEEEKEDALSFELFYLVYAFTLVGFITSCFAEKIPPGFYNTNGNFEICASVLSRITFWWMNGTLIQGFKGLKEEHLMPIHPRDSTATTVPVFRKHLMETTHRARAKDKQREYLESSFYYQHSPPGTKTNVKKKKTHWAENEKTPLICSTAEESNGIYNATHIHTQHHQDSTSSPVNLMTETHQQKRDPGWKPIRVNIFWVAMKTFWWQMVCAQSLMFLQIATVLVSPLIMKEMIQFTGSTEPTWKGYVYAIGLFVTSSLQSVAQHVCLFFTTNIGYRMSSSITSIVYRKALTMNSKARRESTVGEIVNLMSVDARNIEMYTTFSYWMWTSPILIIISLYLLYTTVGVSMFAGLAFLILLFSINTYLMNKLRVFQKAIMKIRDKRVKVINEILNGIKILKLYAWEPSFEEKVDKIRNDELAILLKSSFINSFTTFAWTAALYWVTLFTFLTYVYLDESHTLDASTSFVALSYFNIIRMAVNVLPVVIREGIKTIVSVGRVNTFLNTPDLDESVGRDSNSDSAIEITDATFSWDRDLPPTLKNINLRIKRGSLVAIVGQVGMGKSSLVSSMLGEMELVSGDVAVNGSIAFVPQQAWIQNDTLRNNVLFGHDFDKERYDSVLDACALRPDLEMLAGGDMTEIGEKGINLSGGQKQRVSVARAVYSDADVIVLDDPFSAVDSHVGKHIFNEVIYEGGLLAGKTRVLVTHGVQWLPKVDTIVVLSDGRISEMGSYSELMQHDGAFAQFLTTYLSTHLDGSDDDEDDEEAMMVRRDILQRLASQVSETDSGGEDSAKGRILHRLMSRESEGTEREAHQDLRHRTRTRGDSEGSSLGGARSRHNSWKRSAHHQKDKKEELVDKSKLMTEEEKETGQVNKGVYAELARALGIKYSVVMLVLYSIHNVAALGGNMWLSVWTDDKELANITALQPNSTRRSDLNSFYLGIYAGLGIAQSVFVILYAITMAFRQIHASRLMHRNMLQCLMRAPMSFFDTTPLGRIINRFSQDMDLLDSEICLSVEIWVDSMERVLATVVAITYTTPIFLAVFAPAFIIYYIIMRFYIGTSCQLRRIQSKKRSPIYSHFGESLTGAHVIRAYGAQQRFIQQSENRVDGLLTCTYNSNAAGRWLGIRLDFVGSVLIVFAAIFTVMSRDTLSAGVVGLSLTYALKVTGEMNIVVRMATEMETNFVSVERIAEYTRVESEASWVAIPRPRPDWPQQGRVRFHGYSTRYRPGLDLVLRDLSCNFAAGEKVGIVGRTGAGKSSMTLALFRLIEPAAGTVFVDEVDISSLGLHDLRQKLNILPQDPVIFDGTVRQNLDPTDIHNDHQVWTALEQAHLKSYVQSLPDGLNHVCGEGGENLSVGQRQLLCLARTLLKKTNILILDEATAAVDMETDDLIQNTIRQAFADCTILTIAHRIKTVLDYDRIMVLDGGQMVEFDSPSTLLADPNSAFSKMARDAGILPP